MDNLMSRLDLMQLDVIDGIPILLALEELRVQAMQQRKNNQGMHPIK